KLKKDRSDEWLEIIKEINDEATNRNTISHYKFDLYDNGLIIFVTTTNSGRLGIKIQFSIDDFVKKYKEISDKETFIRKNLVELKGGVSAEELADGIWEGGRAHLTLPGVQIRATGRA